jgi:hypothetical protein
LFASSKKLTGITTPSSFASLCILFAHKSHFEPHIQV